MEILILGVILLILGVGATILYDKQKNREANHVARPRFPGPQTTPAPKSTTYQDINEELLEKFTKHVNTKKSTPIRQKKILKGPLLQQKTLV